MRSGGKKRSFDNQSKDQPIYDESEAISASQIDYKIQKQVPISK